MLDLRPWIGIALAGAVLSGCGDDGPRPTTDGPASERELAARWRDVAIDAREEGIGLDRADGTENRALLHYPVVTGAPTPEVRDRLQAALSVDSAIDLSMAEYRREFRAGNAPTIDVSYRIGYQRDYLLDVRYRVEALGGGGPARYGSRHRVFDLRTGTRVRAAQAFRPESLVELASRVDGRIHQQADAEGASEIYTDAGDAPRRFGAGDLDHFALGDRGATFFLEFGFPHLFSDGPAEAFFTWDELRPYIRPDGPLSVFL